MYNFIRLYSSFTSIWKEKTGSQSNELRREKNSISVLRPGPIQTGLYSHKRRLEILDTCRGRIIYTMCGKNKGADQLCS